MAFSRGLAPHLRVPANAYAHIRVVLQSLRPKRLPFLLPRFGIVSHLAIAVAAVAALAIGAIVLVEHGTLIIRTTEIQPAMEPVPIAPPPVIVPESPPQPVVVAPPVRMPIDSKQWLSAIDRYAGAVLKRSDEQSVEQDRLVEDAATALTDESGLYLAAVKPHLARARIQKLTGDVERSQAAGAELVRLADARRAAHAELWRQFEALDSRVKSALDRAWNIFGRVVARQSLLALSRQLDDLRRDLASFATPSGYDAEGITRMERHEAALAQMVKEAGARLALSQADAAATGVLNDAAPLVAARVRLMQIDHDRRSAAAAFGLESAALVAAAKVEVLPRATAAVIKPIDRPAAQSALVTVVAAPPSTQGLQSLQPQHPELAGSARTGSTSVSQEKGREGRQIAWMSGAVLFLLLLLSAAMIVRIVVPVRRLMRATEQIADGDIVSTRVPRGGIKELDTLAASFNIMAERLSAEQKITRAYQSHLEAKVEERTGQLTHLAAHDPLTDLPNRRQLFMQLGTALESAQAGNHYVGVYFIDLDNFKNINDSMGHAFGDRILQSIAKRLRDLVSPYGFSARLGGDEFTVVYTRAESTEAIREAGLALVRAFQDPLIVDGRELVMSISVGASVFPIHASDAEALLKAADSALFRAKALGRSQLNIYSPELLEAAASRFTTEQGLRRAIERGDFQLVFQPEVSADTLKVTLVEALLRWRLPDGKVVAPADFLAVAEESGLILEISDWVLRTAIATAAGWHHGEWPDVRVAINVSARQMIDPTFVSRVEQLLKDNALPARCIEFELTENILQTGAATIDTLRRLRACGIGTALDDFGTGYSSLASLEQLPLTRVKLDRSLIASIDTNPRSLAITRAIIGLCEGLGLNITAEGVERPEQFALLVNHRLMHVQGFLLSRPIPSDKVLETNAMLVGQLQSLVLSCPALVPHRAARVAEDTVGDRIFAGKGS